MRANWNVWEIGTVGNNPTIWKLDSTDDEATITSSSYALDPAIKAGDLVLASYSANGGRTSGTFSVVSNGRHLMLQNAGNVFTFFNTLYFAVGGNDANPGTNINQPLATLGKAVEIAKTLIAAGTPGSTFVSIEGLGIGIDVSNISIVGFNQANGIYINAPGWQLNPVSGDALTVDLSGGPFDPNGGSYINVVLARSTVAGGAKVLNLIGTTAGHRNVTRFTYAGAVYGDVYLNVPAEFYCTIIAGTLTANQSGTNVVTQYGIGSQTDQSRLNLEGMLFGGGGVSIHGPVNTTNVWRYPMRKIVYLSGDKTLGFSDSGYLYVNNTASTYTITLPDTTGQGTPAFLTGYEATFLNYGSGAINFSAGGVASIIGTTSVAAVARRVNCTLTEANTWVIDTYPGTGP